MQIFFFFIVFFFHFQSKKVKYLVVCLGDEASASFIEVHDNKAHFETPTNKHKPKVYQLENIKPDDLDKVERNQAKEYYLDIPFKKEKMCLMFDSREELALWHDAIVQAINMDAFEEDDLKENFLYESEDSGGYIWKGGVIIICRLLVFRFILYHHSQYVHQSSP